MELWVWWCASVLHVHQPHPYRKIFVGHPILLIEHLENDSLSIPKVDDGEVELKRAYDLRRELPVSQLIDAKELILALNEDKILNLIGETYAFERQLVHPTHFNEHLIYEPLIIGYVLVNPELLYYWPRRLFGHFLLFSLYLWTTGNSLLIHIL